MSTSPDAAVSVRRVRQAVGVPLPLRLRGVDDQCTVFRVLAGAQFGALFLLLTETN